MKCFPAPRIPLFSEVPVCHVRLFILSSDHLLSIFIYVEGSLCVKSGQASSHVTLEPYLP